MRLFYPIRVDTYSPIGTIHREVGRRLPFNVTAFVSDPSKDIELSGINTINISNYKPYKIWNILTKSAFKSPDIVHTGPINHNILNAIKSKFNTTVHIHTIHNCVWSGRGLYPYLHRRILMNACDRLTAVSDYIAVEADRHLFSLFDSTANRQTKVIPNGVDTDLFSPKDASTVPYRILYVGRVDEQKHPEMVAKIAGQLPKYEFHMVVPGINQNELLYRKLKSLYNVKILPKLNHEELAKEYASASILLAPYENEGFGMVVLEALSSGTPVLGLDSGNLPNLLSHSSGRVINDLSIGNWVSAIYDFEGEIEKDARSFALNYSWDKIANQYEAIYLNQLGKTS